MRNSPLFRTGTDAISDSITLGKDDEWLSPEAVYGVAHHHATVLLDPQALERVHRSHGVVMQALRNNQPVYGLTLGVGWNKDRPVFLPAEVTEDALCEHSRHHNHASLRAHAAGIGTPLPEATVRAAMLVRLNMLMQGAAGVQPAVIEQLSAFLRHGLTPVVPGKGSIGMADITQNAHIGLTLIGEWDVIYQGQRISAAEAMTQVGLQPISLIGKDFLALVSSNSLTAARLGLIISESRLFLSRTEVLFALALEGMNGNVTPLMSHVCQARPFRGMSMAAANLRQCLDGSDLWKPSPERHLQDPLSIRNMAYSLGQAYEALQSAYDALVLHINHSDDNPMVCCQLPETLSAIDEQCLVRDASGQALGAIYPSANYDGQPLAIAAEQLAASLARLSTTMSMQLVRTELPHITSLPRFLAHPDNSGHAFGALQKPMLALDRENQTLAQPVTLGQAVMAGSIEDMASFGMQVTDQLERLIINLYEMASLHLLHFSQAVELRQNFVQAPTTARLLQEYRQIVPLVTEDRMFTEDISAGVHFLYQWQPHPPAHDEHMPATR